MMQHKKIEGAELPYRPVDPCELTPAERERIAAARGRALSVESMHLHLIRIASREAPQFDRASRWIVGICRVGSERAIAAELEEAGIEAWCPHEKFRTRPRRGLKPVDIYRAFFRGYVFVRVVPSREAFAGVLRASRLSGLMGRGETPFLMPETLMDKLMLSMRKRLVLQEDEMRLPVSVGDRVRVTAGPFAAFTAMVRALLPERWQAELEVEIFGRMTPVTIDIDSLSYDT